MDEHRVVERMFSDRQALQVAELLTDCRVRTDFWRSWQVHPGLIHDGHPFPYAWACWPTLGRYRVRVGEQSQVIGPGEFFFADAFVPTWVEVDEGCEFVETVTAMIVVQSAARRSLLPQFGSAFGKLPGGFNAAEMTAVVSLYQSHADAGRLYGDCVLRMMLGNMILEGVAFHQPTTEMDERVARAIATIHRSFAEPLSITELAEACHVSEVQFRKLFRRAMDVSPKTYITRYRIEQAASLLCGSKQTVKEIAFRVGFNDSHYFCTSFKQLVGCSPTTFRRRWATGDERRELAEWLPDDDSP